MPRNTDNIEQDEPQLIDWDGSPLTKQAWYNALPLRLRKYRTLIERGYMVHGKTIVTSSPSHSYHLSINNIEEGSFAKPNPLKSFRLEDPSEATKTLAGEKASRYVDSVDELIEDDKDLFDDFAKSISNKQKRKDYKRACKSSGIAALILVAKEIAEANDDLAGWAAVMRAQHVLRGIAAPTCIAFDTFREHYEEYTQQMGDRAESEIVTAKVYVDAARALGDSIMTKLDLRLDVQNPAGDLDKTVAIISNILSKHETSTSTGKHAGHGHARSAADKPKDAEKSRFHDANGRRIFVVGVDDACSICNGKHGGGNHLRINCPDYVRPDDKNKDNNKGKAKDKRKGHSRAAGGLTDAESSDGESAPYDENDDAAIISASDVALSSLFSGGEKSITVTKKGSVKAAGKGKAQVPPPQPDELSSASE